MTPEERKEYMKKWRKNNANYQKEYRENNPDKEKEYRKNRLEYQNKYQKEYRKNNLDKVNCIQNKYRNKKLKTDPLFKLNANIRTLLFVSFKRKGFSKSSRTHEILGCTFEEFKKHLESKFQPWMNWDNHGLYNGSEGYGWDIDHIKPLSSAKSEEELIKLNHYSNLQPLCSYVNRVIKRNH
jgi:hypothetical protein